MMKSLEKRSSTPRSILIVMSMGILEISREYTDTYHDCDKKGSLPMRLAPIVGFVCFQMPTQVFILA